MTTWDEETEGPRSAESDESNELSEKAPDTASGEGDTPLGSSDEHSDAPGSDGLGGQRDKREGS